MLYKNRVYYTLWLMGVLPLLAMEKCIVPPFIRALNEHRTFHEEEPEDYYEDGKQWPQWDYNRANNMVWLDYKINDMADEAKSAHESSMKSIEICCIITDALFYILKEVPPLKINCKDARSCQTKLLEIIKRYTYPTTAIICTNKPLGELHSFLGTYLPDIKEYATQFFDSATIEKALIKKNLFSLFSGRPGPFTSLKAAITYYRDIK